MLLDSLFITSYITRASSTKASGHKSRPCPGRLASVQPGRLEPPSHVVPKTREHDKHNIVPAPVSLKFLSQVVSCQHRRPLLTILLPV